MMDRRTFIQGAALAAATPAFAALVPLPSDARSSIATVTNPAPYVNEDGSDVKAVVFNIDGWDLSDVKTSTENEVLIRINQSWRTAWR
jgi:TAT (twin-arginine translocation) pathway signal sequence